MNQMGRSKINYRNDEVPAYYAWNPGGCGCSGGCDGCWARAGSARMGNHCPKCKAFDVHLHEERLRLPACTSPGGVVLVNFTCDTFDMKRPLADRVKILRAAFEAKHHNYVFLTKNGIRMALDFETTAYDPFWWLGLSICNQRQADTNLPALLQIPRYRLWLSIEPLWERINMDCVYPVGESDDDGHPLSNLAGVIVGHDKRPDAPGSGTLDHVRCVVDQCRQANVPVFVKQLHIDGKLRHTPEHFPEDLRQRDLPWSMPDRGRK